MEGEFPAVSKGPCLGEGAPVLGSQGCCTDRALIGDSQEKLDEAKVKVEVDELERVVRGSRECVWSRGVVAPLSLPLGPGGEKRVSRGGDDPVPVGCA